MCKPVLFAFCFQYVLNLMDYVQSTNQHHSIWQMGQFTKMYGKQSKIFQKKKQVMRRSRWWKIMNKKKVLVISLKFLSNSRENLPAENTLFTSARCTRDGRRQIFPQYFEDEIAKQQYYHLPFYALFFFLQSVSHFLD